MKTTFRDCGIDDKRITAESLRYTYSLEIINNGGSVLELSKSLNHKTLTSTDKLIKTFDRLKNPVEDGVDFGFNKH